MNSFLINANELEALSGLPHWQQLTYLRGIRPYMDVQSGITGIKRKISHQSLTEQLYIEPHQGIKSESFSRAQVRRAVAALERVGLVSNLSRQKQLILKCELATLGYYAQNKAVTNPSQKAVTKPSQKNPVVACSFEDSDLKPDHGNTPKADTPLKEDNYLYLLRRFEQFWQLYPEKKAPEPAFTAFEEINPDDKQLGLILDALKKQIKARSALESQGQWVPAWQFPANWLLQRRWKDEINVEIKQEKKYAKHRPDTRKTATTSNFYIPDEYEQDREQGTVLPFRRQ